MSALCTFLHCPESEVDNVFTEQVNKIVLSFNNGKILQSFNGVKSFVYGVSVGRVCKELLHVKIKNYRPYITDQPFRILIIWPRNIKNKCITQSDKT